LFSDLVSDDVLAAYQRLLDADGCDDEDSAIEMLGSAELVKELSRVGMAQMCPDPATGRRRFVPAPPELALEGALIGLLGDVRRTHEKLISGYQRLNKMPAIPVADGYSNAFISVITDRTEIMRMSIALMNKARKNWMSLDNQVLESPRWEDDAEPPLPAFAGEVTCRAIYENAIMDNPAGAELIRHCMDAGEQARLLPSIPMKLKLVDDTAALLPLTATGMGGAVLIRSYVIISAIREYFEMLWQRAIPVGSTKTHTGTPLSEMDFTILRLMVEGKPDRQIAGKLGVAEPTVRRHIDTIKTALDAPNRVAAVAAAFRRGWID